ncbi:hypothetical protein C5167_042588 [Papaver somniferum]|uniref:Uncharacterized protein n=1 Tax=Papaver somniferum TaxID=3469 RepID=A0A4Y7L6V3_PAPSO|nr:hypothetical protein C5167_042588 [Papaver somniferum]
MKKKEKVGSAVEDEEEEEGVETDFRFMIIDFCIKEINFDQVALGKEFCSDAAREIAAPRTTMCSFAASTNPLFNLRKTSQTNKGMDMRGSRFIDFALCT